MWPGCITYTLTIRSIGSSIGLTVVPHESEHGNPVTEFGGHGCGATGRCRGAMSMTR